MSLPVVELEVNGQLQKQQTQATVQVEIANLTDQIAFFTNLNIIGAESREAVVPLYCSENYITLLPGESRTVTISYSTSNLSEKPILVWEGVNLTAGEVGLE